MKDEQKVYIKGNLERGNEIIKFLEDLGGNNFYSLNGQKSNNYYFINSKGVIDCTTALSGKTYSFIKKSYKKIELPRWKPQYRDSYFYVDADGLIVEEVWYNKQIDESRYEFGNCFVGIDEAETARDKIRKMLNN